MSGIVGDACYQGDHDNCYVEGCECLCHEFKERPGQATSYAEGTDR